MYLEMFKGKDVVIEVNEKLPSEYKDYLMSQTYKLAELAKFLGAKTVNVNGDSMHKPVIRYYYGEISTPINGEIVIDVYWCDLNKALVLENIWIKNKLIGMYEFIGKNSVKPNTVLSNEEFAFFDIKLSNYDFTLQNNKIGGNDGK